MRSVTTTTPHQFQTPWQLGHHLPRPTTMQPTSVIISLANIPATTTRNLNLLASTTYSSVFTDMTSYMWQFETINSLFSLNQRLLYFPCVMNCTLQCTENTWVSTSVHTQSITLFCRDDL